VEGRSPIHPMAGPAGFDHGRSFFLPGPPGNLAGKTRQPRRCTVRGPAFLVEERRPPALARRLLERGA
jgi:hypothetical protein